MKLNQLQPNIAKPARKRRGQGRGTGNGTFGGRGNKGQNARAGGGVRPGFEGGQTPLIQRMPKNKGFRNINKVQYLAVNVATLENLYTDGEIVSLETLKAKGAFKKNGTQVKILGNGDISTKVTLAAELKASASAQEKITKAGGTVEKK